VSSGTDVMKSESFNLSRGDVADIAFIMTTERQPGYDTLVGRWSEARHRAALVDEHYAYFIARLDAQPVGFAIVRDWASIEYVTCIKRIAVVHPGSGHGRVFLAHLVDRIFRDTDAHRIWLGVFPDNMRARRAYESIGFRAEGIARGSAFFGGVHRDELIMALLRPEWRPDRSLFQIKAA
jgi:diamine N-acetyltransferase